MNRRVQGQRCQRYAGTPFISMPDISSDKQSMRAQLRDRRRALDKEQQLAASLQLANYATRVPAWDTASTVALYLPNDGEIDPTPLAIAASSGGKTIALPVVSGEHLEFAVWEGPPSLSSSLQRNRYNILEPTESAARVSLQKIDLLCVPLVAWDRRGGRLGMGGGYYDRYLANGDSPVLMGLGHAWQEVPGVPCGPQDVRMNFIATDAALIFCQD